MPLIPTPEKPPVLADEARQAKLAATIASEAADGWRVESRSDYQASLLKGKPTSHLLHLVLTLLTFGLWLFVWIGVAIFAGQKSKVVTVDAYGYVTTSR